MARFSASMASFAKRFIFVTGGQDPATYTDLNSTNMYDIQNNTWQVTPRLVQARSSHSSCSLASFVYVFGGHNDKTVERLNASADVFPETWD